MNLDKMQEKVNQMYKDNGNKINDEILELQVKINTERNKLNIPDESEMIYKKFVQ